MADRIVSDPDVLGGAPCFAGTRIPVRLVAGALRSGDSVETVLREYGRHLTLADVLAAAWWGKGRCRTASSRPSSSAA